MKYVCSLAVVCSTLLLAGCDRAETRRPPRDPKPSVRIFCGSSMVKPMQEIAEAFTKQSGLEVIVDQGGSETLLPRVIAGENADIFVCHDPFEQKVRDADQLADSVAVASLRPALLVRPENPQGIKGIEDLANPGLQIGIGHPQYSTCGQLFVELLERRKLKEKVMANVTLQARSHAEIVNGLTLGPLDAVVVWNFIAPQYGEKVRVIPTPDADYPDVRVTILSLKRAEHPVQRDEFMAFCRKPEVAQTFARHSYATMK